MSSENLARYNALLITKSQSTQKSIGDNVVSTYQTLLGNRLPFELVRYILDFEEIPDLVEIRITNFAAYLNLYRFLHYTIIPSGRSLIYEWNSLLSAWTGQGNPIPLIEGHINRFWPLYPETNFQVDKSVLPSDELMQTKDDILRACPFGSAPKDAFKYWHSFLKLNLPKEAVLTFYHSSHQNIQRSMIYCLDLSLMRCHKNWIYQQAEKYLLLLLRHEPHAINYTDAHSNLRLCSSILNLSIEGHAVYFTAAHSSCWGDVDFVKNVIQWKCWEDGKKCESRLIPEPLREQLTEAEIQRIPARLWQKQEPYESISDLPLETCELNELVAEYARKRKQSFPDPSAREQRVKCREFRKMPGFNNSPNVRWWPPSTRGVVTEETQQTEEHKPLSDSKKLDELLPTYELSILEWDLIHE